MSLDLTPVSPWGVIMRVQPVSTGHLPHRLSPRSSQRLAQVRLQLHWSLKDPQPSPRLSVFLGVTLLIF